jgi:hypothetical protein
MKKLLLPLLLISSTMVFAQNTQVQLSFQRDYPDVQDVRWDQTNDQWHGSYRDGRNRNMDVYYDNYGNRRETRTEWDRRDVPTNVDSRINRRYHTNGEYRIQRIERPAYRPLFQIRIGTRRPVYMDDGARRRRYYNNY